MRITRLKATIFTVLFCLAVIYTARFFIERTQRSSIVKVPLARTKGDPKAQVRITEYIDFQCPACAKGAKLLKEYIARYPSQIYLEVKYFPLNRTHEHALESAVYAECAAKQNKFWAFEELLIEKQLQWDKLTHADGMFKEMAENAQLNLAKLEACVKNDSVKVAIFRDKSDGKSLGVDSTPTYFVNGKMAVGINPLSVELGKYFGEKSHQ